MGDTQFFRWEAALPDHSTSAPSRMRKLNPVVVNPGQPTYSEPHRPGPGSHQTQLTVRPHTDAQKIKMFRTLSTGLRVVPLTFSRCLGTLHFPEMFLAGKECQ